MQALANPNRVVLAHLDGSRSSGHIYDFSLARESFHFFPGQELGSEPSSEIRLSELKAIFFVRDFKGDPHRQDRTELLPTGHGRRVRVTFQDGETIVGTTEGFVNLTRNGFFLFPADQGSNNNRIFVVMKNIRGVKQVVVPSKDDKMSILMHS